jgi:hypothetical protein
MPSNLFNFADAKFLAPIVCVGCGNNAYVIRREPKGESLELQTFFCSECKTETQRVRGVDLSDGEIQGIAERYTGISKR